MDELLVGIPEDIIQQPCSDKDLDRIAEELVEWEIYAPSFGLIEAEVGEIRNNHPRNYLLQKQKMLRIWKAKNQWSNATYHQLACIFYGLNNNKMVNVIRDVLQNPEEGCGGYIQDPTLSEFQSFLVSAYQSQIYPGMIPDQTPQVKFPVYVNLTIEKQRDKDNSQLKGRETEIQSGLKPGSIELRNIFNERTASNAKRGHMIIIRGDAGAGKTMLTWHASQQWALKKMFHDTFLLFFSIPLRSSSVQKAIDLADLIPHPDKRHRKDIAQAIASKQGAGTCFWFDGWDELPEILQRQSFIGSFIKRDNARNSLPLCSIVVTTRSTDSLPDSSTVVIERFTSTQIEEYITANLKDNPGNIQHFNEKIRTLQDFCSLPINLAIMMHLFLSFDMSLPTTATQLFKCLSLNLLLRNLQTRWNLEVNIRALKDFAMLPGDASSCFRNLCKISFNGVMSSRTVFTGEEMQQANLPLSHCTMGLMRIDTKSAWFGQENEFSFLHPTLQEFLAAVHITLMESHVELTDCLQKLREMKNRNMIIQFYAGISKLKHEKARNMLMQVCKEPMAYGGLFQEVEETRCHSLLLLCQCIYETQSRELCRRAIKLLLEPKVRVRLSTGYLADTSIFMFQNYYQLDFSFAPTNVGSADLKALGYLIGECCKDYTCRVRMIDVAMYGKIFDNFIKELTAICHQTSHHKPTLSLTIHTVAIETIDHEGVEILCGLIKNTHLLSGLSLRPDFGALRPNKRSMKHMIEAFARNTSCTMLHLYLSSALVSEAEHQQTEYYLILLLTCCEGIRELGLHLYFPGYLFTAALKYNHSLIFLDLTDCIFGDDIFILLKIAEALKSNYKLQALAVGGALNEEKLTILILSIIDSSLFVLLTSVKINDKHTSAIEYLKNVRQHDPFLRLKRRLPIFSVFDSIERASGYMAVFNRFF